MKRIIVLIAALSLLAVPVQAQGLLNKLKEKAGQAVGSKIGNALGIELPSEAYSEFPCDYPPMYNEEVVSELDLSKVPGDGRAWFPEFSVFGASHFDEIAAGKYIFASNEKGEVYQFSGGSWTRLSDERIKELGEMKTGAAAAKGQTWTSADGLRTVTFNSGGGGVAGSGALP